VVDYVKTMIDELSERLSSQQTDGLQDRFQTLREELDQLNPPDFEPVSRFKFVHLRRLVRRYATLGGIHARALAIIVRWDPTAVGASRLMTILHRLELPELAGRLTAQKYNVDDALCASIIDETKKRLTELSGILDSYLGPDVQGESREFTFVRDPELRAIVERDYRDLMLRLFPMRSWKSVVILAGSILEALLHDLLTRDQDRIQAAMATNAAPKRPRDKPPAGPRNLLSRDAEDQWMLNHYIDVSDKLELLPPGWKPRVTAVLRDFRNYVHPRNELAAPDRISEGEGFLSIGAIISICEYIERKHP
jgi:hypothetical protein